LGAKQQEAFDEIKSYLTSPPVLQAPKSGVLSGFMLRWNQVSLGLI
jgi:hypothetical protein